MKSMPYSAVGIWLVAAVPGEYERTIGYPESVPAESMVA